MNAIARIFDAWTRGRGALLYGPPGTGKTRTLGELFQALTSDEEPGDTGIVLDPHNPTAPLDRPQTAPPIPLPARLLWVTFHQSFTYEDWILGLRPEPLEGVLVLRPRMGALLDGIYELASPESEFKSLVVLVDELNRGNAARIFGEFLTFLDVDYRLADAEGNLGPLTLPLPLRQITVNGDRTEQLLRPNGQLVTLTWPVYFPRHVYFVGTMNSVDRAAIPIDSALARRFDRIEMSPDLPLLADWFSLDLNSLEAKAAAGRQPNSGSWADLSAYETALMLLDRINVFIATEIGAEFELGHGLLMPVRDEDEETRWMNLAKAWDDVVFPQIEDRFSGRPEELIALLKVESPPGELEYAFSFRRGLGGQSQGRAIGRVKLSDIESDVRKRSLQWLSV